MKIGIYISLIAVLVSCKKNHTCECKNSNGLYIAGEYEKTTKRKAKKSCTNLSQGDTNCNLK